MANNTVHAADNPNLVNQIAAQATAEPENKIAPAELTAPSDNLVTLPGGYISPTGEVIRTAEVRELTGRDEEAIGKLGSSSRLFHTIVDRATVSVGNLKASEELLDTMLSGDRDALLLGIYKATFGPTAELGGWCEGCKEVKTVAIDVDTDIEVKALADPAKDRTFTVQGRNSEFLVTLPTGHSQKLILAAAEKSSGEITTVLLQECVLEIDGQSVYAPLQVQRLGVADRRTLVNEISKRNPGPKFEPVIVTCPDCDGEVTVPLSLGSLFPF